ncbi:MAG: lipopolysaccharide heptosyltransferase II [Candidatus Melainabacteria bacterium]|nr:lipopolysaccharide heptosyltransferase II [Candidatus Melainabacteria bacterium]
MESLRGFEPRNIIVRMPNWIGDLVMATPILSDLRKTYPKARITAMCRSPICELLKEDPEIDELFCFSKTSGFGRRTERRNIIEKLRKGGYDLGILLTHSFSSAWWFWLGKVQNRLGYECNGRKFLLTHNLPFPQNIQNQHLVITYKMLLEPLGIPVSDTIPKLYLAPKEINDARALFRQYGIPEGARVVGINPGATYGSAKCWLPERFREVTQKLLTDKDIYVVYFGDQVTVSLVEEICAGLSPRVINLAGATSLRQLGALIASCDVLLTNDSGPMHIADALGTPVVALFGSTSEIVTGPYRSGIVIHKHVECSPCYQRTCPIDFRCMKRVEADEVYEAIIRTLNAKRSKLHVIS